MNNSLMLITAGGRAVTQCVRRNAMVILTVLTVVLSVTVAKNLALSELNAPLFESDRVQIEQFKQSIVSEIIQQLDARCVHGKSESKERVKCPTSPSV